MNRLEIELPEEALTALQITPEEATEEARRILAIHWFAQGRISQGTGARIAGLSRHEFLITLGKAKVSAIQVDADELRKEILLGVEADRECKPVDSPQ
jgi:predicted HTH domain antitoxin